jgi:hypothetical protein
MARDMLYFYIDRTVFSPYAISRAPTGGLFTFEQISPDAVAGVRETVVSVLCFTAGENLEKFDFLFNVNTFCHCELHHGVTNEHHIDTHVFY